MSHDSSGRFSGQPAQSRRNIIRPAQIVEKKMRTVLTALAAIALVALVATPVLAGDPDGTLYQQEGTGADGYGTINADGQGPAQDATDNWTNWIWQTGGGSWSGVYRDDGWLTEASSGDPNVDIEADIEMYYSEEYTNNKIYFHIGNIYTALQNPETDLTATFNGTFSSNNGMYIGICFENTGKAPEDMLTDENGYTGEVQDAMVGTIDVLGRPISDQSFNAKFLLSSDAGATWETPITYGEGASGTVLETLWWLVEGGAAGTHNVTWKVELLPAEHQPDGNYNLDPALVIAPLL